MRLKNKTLQELFNNVKQIASQKWTYVRMDYREEFIAIANTFGVYPCGGAFLYDMSAQVFYID